MVKAGAQPPRHFPGCRWRLSPLQPGLRTQLLWKQLLVVSAALQGALNSPRGSWKSHLLFAGEAQNSQPIEGGEKVSGQCQSNDISGRADGINSDGKSGTGCHSHPKLWVNVLFKAHEVCLCIGHLGPPQDDPIDKDCRLLKSLAQTCHWSLQNTIFTTVSATNHFITIHRS